MLVSISRRPSLFATIVGTHRGFGTTRATIVGTVPPYTARIIVCLGEVVDSHEWASKVEAAEAQGVASSINQHLASASISGWKVSFSASQPSAAGDVIALPLGRRFKGLSRSDGVKLVDEIFPPSSRRAESRQDGTGSLPAWAMSLPGAAGAPGTPLLDASQPCSETFMLTAADSVHAKWLLSATSAAQPSLPRSNSLYSDLVVLPSPPQHAFEEEGSSISGNVVVYSPTNADGSYRGDWFGNVDREEQCLALAQEYLQATSGGVSDKDLASATGGGWVFANLSETLLPLWRGQMGMEREAQEELFARMHGPQTAQQEVEAWSP